MENNFIYLVVDSTSEGLAKNSVYGAYSDPEEARKVAYHPYSPLTVLEVPLDGKPGAEIVEL